MLEQTLHARYDSRRDTLFLYQVITVSTYQWPTLELALRGPWGRVRTRHSVKVSTLDSLRYELP